MKSPQIESKHKKFDSDGALWAEPCAPPSDSEDYRDSDGDLWSEPYVPPSDSEDYRDSDGALWAEPCVPPSDDSDHGSDIWVEPAVPPSDSEDEQRDSVTPNRNNRRLTPAPPSRNSLAIDDHSANDSIMNENTPIPPDLAPPNLDLLTQWSPMILGHHHILRQYSPTHNPNLHQGSPHSPTRLNGHRTFSN